MSSPADGGDLDATGGAAGVCCSPGRWTATAACGGVPSSSVPSVVAWEVGLGLGRAATCTTVIRVYTKLLLND